MRNATVVLLLLMTSLGVGFAQEEEPVATVATGLFPILGVHSNVCLDHADGVAYPSEDPEFGASGVAEAFDAFYRAQIAGAGCNTVGVDIAVPCDVETTANQLANLCTWAASFEAANPYLLVSFTGLREAEDTEAWTANVRALVAGVAGKLIPAEGEAPLVYQRIVGYRLAPAVNILQAAKGISAEEVSALAGAAREAMRGAESETFGEEYVSTPLIVDLSMDYAVLGQGGFTGTELSPEMLDAAYGEVKSLVEQLNAETSADVVGLDWLPGTLSSGTSDDLVSVVQRLAGDFPEQGLLIGVTGASTAFDTETAQADFCLGLLAGLAAQMGAAPGLLGLCWAADLDTASPDAPDLGVATRVASWDPAEAAGRAAAALRGDEVDADTAWWFGRSTAGLGLAVLGGDGLIEDKIASAGLKGIVGGGLAMAEGQETIDAVAEEPVADDTGEATEIVDTGDTPETGETTDTPAGPAELYVAGLVVAEGTLQEGEAIVLRATLANRGGEDAAAVKVDFSFVTEGSDDWKYTADDSLETTIPAGGQVDVDSPLWTVPAQVADIGVIAWREGITEQNEDDNAFVARAEDLATGQVVAAEAPPTEEWTGDEYVDTGGGGRGDSVMGPIKSLLEQKKMELAEQLIGAVGEYFLGKVGDLLGGIGGGGSGTGDGTETWTSEDTWEAPETATTEGAAAAEGIPDLAVESLDVQSGTLQAGRQVVFSARISNLSMTADAPDSLVDFSYITDEMSEWGFLAPESLVTSVTAGGQVTVSAPAWQVPDGLLEIGVVVSTATGTDADPSNDTLSATATDLAGGGGVVTTADLGPDEESVDPGTGATDPGTGTTDPGTGTTDPGTGTTDPGTGAVTPTETGPVDLSVKSLVVSQGTLAAGQQVVLQATIGNASATSVDAYVDFSSFSTGDADWQFVSGDPIAVTVPAGGQTNVSTPLWTVPTDLQQIGAVVWRETGEDATEDNNSLVATAADLGAGAVTPETTETTDPGTDPVDPGTDPVDPGTDPGDPGTDPVDPGTDPGEEAVTPTDTGPVDLSVKSVTLAQGTLAAGQQVALQATIGNASATSADAYVDFSSFSTGDADWQFVTGDPIAVTVPAGGEAQVSTPLWSVPTDLLQIGVVVWRETGEDSAEGNNSLVATAADLGAGAVTPETADTPEPDEGTPEPTDEPDEGTAEPADEPEDSGPIDLSVKSVALAQGTLAAGQQVVLQATIGNASTTSSAAANVDFSSFSDGDADWQFVTAEPIEVTVPAGGQTNVSTPLWTVPNNLLQVGTVVWRSAGMDDQESNNTLVATAADLGGGAVTPEDEGGEGSEGEAVPGEILVIQKPKTAVAKSKVEFLVEIPATRTLVAAGTARLKVAGATKSRVRLRDVRGAGALAGTVVKKIARGMVYLKVNGETKGQARLRRVRRGGPLTATLTWTPAAKGEYAIEIVVPGGKKRIVEMQVTVKPAKVTGRLPQVFRTPAILKAVELSKAGLRVAEPTAGGRLLPAGAGVSTAVRLAAKSALLAAPPAATVRIGTAPTGLQPTGIRLPTPTMGTAAVRLPTPATGIRLPTPTTGIRLPTPVTGTAVKLPTPTTGVKLPTTGVRLPTPTTGVKTPTTGIRLPTPTTGVKTPTTGIRLPTPTTGVKTPTTGIRLPTPTTGVKTPTTGIRLPTPTTGVKTPTTGVKTPTTGVRLPTPTTGVKTPTTGVKTPTTGVRLPTPTTGVKTPTTGIRLPTPTTGVKTPTTGVRTPTTGVRLPTPTTGVKTPTTGVKTPTTGVKTPTTGIRLPTPTTGVKTPTTGVKTPTTGVKTPTTGTRTPTTGIRLPTPTTGVRTPTTGVKTPTTTVGTTTPPRAVPVSVALTLPGGAVSAGRRAWINYNVTPTNGKITAISFVLKFDPKAISVSAPSLKGTNAAKLGWRVSSRARADGLQITVSGTRPLSGTGKLLSVVVATKNPKGASARLQVAFGKVNGKTASIRFTGGSVRVTP